MAKTKKKQQAPQFGPKVQRHVIKLIGAMYGEMGPVMRAELRGVLQEVDNLTRDERTYRARLRGMKTQPGQLVMRVAAEMEVEVFAETKDRWKARYIPVRVVMPRLKASSREGIQSMVEAEFTEMLEGWTTYLKDGSIAPEELTPESLTGDSAA